MIQVEYTWQRPVTLYCKLPLYMNVLFEGLFPYDSNINKVHQYLTHRGEITVEVVTPFRVHMLLIKFMIEIEISW